jgi:hypothetical protein
MYELHDREQYFFDRATLDHLTEFLQGFERPCCLCAPLLGKALVERGVGATILDTDDRFADVPGYAHFDLYRPHWLGQDFDVVVCDPPFFNVSLSQLFSAVRIVAGNDFKQSLLVCNLRRRASAVVGTFARFGLQPTGYMPTYQTVTETERNEVEFFSNLGEDAVARLRET